MQKSTTNKLTIAAVSIAAAASFGVGAAALAQGGVEFNPNNFASAYTQGSDGSSEGYRANPTAVDAEANRQSEDGEDADKTAGSQGIDDAFSNMPIDGQSGTTAYNVVGDASSGVLVSMGGTANGNGEGLSAGAVIGDGGNGGNSAGGTTNGDNASKGNSNNGNNGNNGGATTDDDPYADPAAPWNQPLDDKPGSSFGDAVPANGKIPILETITASNVDSLLEQDYLRFAIQKNVLTDEGALYQGQTLDKWTVFCALMTQFGYRTDADADFEWYEWTCTREEFDNYQFFKVIDFPKTVPDGPFDITVQFRFSNNDAWHTETISYTPEQSCLMVVDSADYTSDSQVQRNIEAPAFLYQYADMALKQADAVNEDDNTLSKLLLNWVVDGKDVGFKYDPEPGRHVAVPGTFVDLPSYYRAEVQSFWITDDYEVDFSGKYSRLQTLTGVQVDSPAYIADAEGNLTLVVPNGIQAISVGFFDSIYTNKLVVPSSLLVIDPTANTLLVADSYSVAADNPAFANTPDGILTNKAGDKYEALPLNLTDLDVPEGVSSVEVSNWNQLRHVYLHGSDASALASIDLSKLDQCTIELDDDAFYDFVRNNYDVLNGEDGLRVSKASEPDVEYRVAHNMLYSDDALEYVFPSMDSSVEVQGATTIASGAFADAFNITTVQLSGDADYALEDGCFEGSNVQLIVCNTQQQFDYVKSRLEAAGVPNAQVALAQTGTDGFSYYIASDGWDDTVTITRAPADLVSFDGTIRSASGDVLNVDAIGPNAFTQCQDLRWVTLSESTKSIGANAFDGCGSLETLFISAPDYIQVGSETIANCWNLQYVVSRAWCGDFATADQPNSNCTMYCPTNNVGYTQYFTYFTEESNVEDYGFVRQDDGNLVLYGSATRDGEELRWLVIGTGKYLTGEIKLPAETQEIFSSAFAYTSGDFTVNWDDLTDLQYIDGYAFSGSSINGSIRLGVGGDYGRRIQIFDYAFTDCWNVESFEVVSQFANVGGSAFANCPNLQSVTIASNKDYLYRWSLETSFVANAPEGLTITFTGSDPIDLSPMGAGYGYLFDGWYLQDEEAQRIHLDIPEEYQDAYIRSWSYAFAGYADYDAMHDAIYTNLWKGSNYEVVPTEFEVQKVMAESLLTAENHLRTMMGLPSVDVSTVLPITETDDGYSFVTMGGKTTLAAVPSDATVVDLNQIIPDDVEKVTIGSDAFAECTSLQRVILSDKVQAISNNAFKNCDGVEVVLPSATADTIPELLVDYSALTAQFTFGANVKLNIPADSADVYLRYWTWQDNGYSSEGDIKFLASWFYYGDDIKGDALNEVVNAPFMEFENYLRALAGMPQVTELKDLASFYDAAAVFEEAESRGEGGGVLPPDVFDDENVADAVDGQPDGSDADADGEASSDAAAKRDDDAAAAAKADGAGDASDDADDAAFASADDNLAVLRAEEEEPEQEA